MSMLIPLLFVSGAALGLRFNVFVLLPGIVVTTFVALAIGTAKGDGLLSILLGELFALVALQTGYIGGVLIRYAVTEALPGAHRRPPLRAESPR